MQILCIDVVYNDLDLRKWAPEANWTSFSGPVWDLLMKVDNIFDTDRIAGCLTNYKLLQGDSCAIENHLLI